MKTDDATKLCISGQQVLEVEARSLQEMAQRLDHSFAQACSLLLECSGRVITVGMGKSGHIAKKIAATLASTGTPAFFIHPGEAIHGDLGMITPKDIIIIVSHSGETNELLSILPMIKLLNIPLIGIIGEPRSTLAQMSTLVLNTQVEYEACPHNLTPTSSTTCALAMGDALAVATFSARGFTPEDFARNHPGGSLGRRLLTRVHQLMSIGDDIPQVTHKTSVGNALDEMTRKKLGFTVVVDSNQKLLGIFTDGDIRRALQKHSNIQNLQVEEVMSRHPRTISAETLTHEAVAMMEQSNITSLIVSNDAQEILGVVHLHQLLQSGIL